MQNFIIAVVERELLLTRTKRHGTQEYSLTSFNCICIHCGMYSISLQWKIKFHGWIAMCKNSLG